MERDYDATYLVCKTSQQPSELLKAFPPRYINVHTLAPIIVASVSFMFLCVIFDAPTGSVVFATIAVVFTRLLLFYDQCFSDIEMLALLLTLAASLWLGRRLPPITMVAVALVGGAAALLAMEAGLGGSREESFKRPSPGPLLVWLRQACSLTLLPLITKVTLDHTAGTQSAGRSALGWVISLLLLALTAQARFLPALVLAAAAVAVACAFPGASSATQPPARIGFAPTEDLPRVRFAPRAARRATWAPKREGMSLPILRVARQIPSLSTCQPPPAPSPPIGPIANGSCAPAVIPESSSLQPLTPWAIVQPPTMIVTSPSPNPSPQRSEEPCDDPMLPCQLDTIPVLSDDIAFGDVDRDLWLPQKDADGGFAVSREASPVKPCGPARHAHASPTPRPWSPSTRNPAIAASPTSKPCRPASKRTASSSHVSAPKRIRK